MYAIKELGEVGIITSDVAKFYNRTPSLCVALTIKEPDFNAKSDKKTRMWTISCKWSDDQPSNKLTKCLNTQCPLKCTKNINVSFQHG